MSNKTAIVFILDKNYFHYLPVSLITLADNYNGKEKLDIKILVENQIAHREQEFISIVNRTEKLNIEFINPKRYDNVRRSGIFKSKAHWGETTYLRLFMASELPDYDKAIYVDGDTMFCRDISPILEFPLNNKICASLEIVDFPNWTFKPDFPYFNAGVFITDLNYWREIDVEEKALDILKEEGTVFGEQDLLNKILCNVLYPMPNSFNCFSRWYEILNIIENARDPILVHFAGPDDKPWLKDTKVNPWVLKWREVYKNINFIGVSDPKDKVF